jgi:hypothetical protein
MQPRHVVAALVLVACGKSQAPPPPLPPPSAIAPQPSYRVLDCDLTITLAPDKPKILAGEPVFVTLTTASACDKDLYVIDGGDYRNRHGRADSFTFSAFDRSGRAEPVKDPGPSFGGLVGPNPIKKDAPWKKRMLLAHWFDFTTAGVYKIAVKKTLFIGAASTPEEKDKTELPIVVETSLEVMPPSREGLGTVIDVLAKDLGGTDYDKQHEAMTALTTIQDDRVVPVFARIVDGPKSTMQTEAVWGVGKFASDDAVAVLVRALSNDDIRLAAAQQLGENKNPKAWDALWALRNDKDSNVRLTVLHALAKRTTPPSERRERLAEFEKDPAQIIRDEAKRYLSER